MFSDNRFYSCDKLGKVTTGKGCRKFIHSKETTISL